MTDQADEASFGPGADQVGERVDAGRDTLDTRALARDWITLWQSELTAMAADREMREGWQTTACTLGGRDDSYVADCAPRTGPGSAARPP